METSMHPQKRQSLKFVEVNQVSSTGVHVYIAPQPLTKKQMKVVPLCGQ